MSDISDIQSWAHVYWTHSDLFGRAFTEKEMIDTIEKIAVEDLLEALGRLSCMIEGARTPDAGQQLRIFRRMGFDQALVDQLEKVQIPREGSQPRAFFFSQQIVELTRLSLRHGDRRPRDGFASGKLAGSFIRAVFGVTDLLGRDLEDGTHDAARSFMLRQLGLGARQEPLYLFGRYYELLVRLWPRVHTDPTPFEPAIEFEQYTGISLEDFFILGFCVYMRFLNHVDSDTEAADFALYPAKYFETTKLTPAEWEPFLALITSAPDVLTQALADEEAQYGPTTYRSHSFDRAPLVRLADGAHVPTSFAALERALTEGAFWILADAAEAKGLKREAFTSPFGKVFERYAQEALERIAAGDKHFPTPFPDFEYGPKKHRTLSSDMSLIYEVERTGVFFEVVTGRPSVATTTRGDNVAFREDLRRLVFKKAGQLRRCWRDFFTFGSLRFDGVHNEGVQRIWPVLIMVEEFPLMPPIYGEVITQLRADGWPKIAPPLSILDADELGALEALVEDGWSALDVIATWRRRSPGLPLSNWIDAFLPDGVGHAAWHVEAFDELTELLAQKVFGKSMTDIRGLSL